MPPRLHGSMAAIDLSKSMPTATAYSNRAKTNSMKAEQAEDCLRNGPNHIRHCDLQHQRRISPTPRSGASSRHGCPPSHLGEAITHNGTQAGPDRLACSPNFYVQEVLSGGGRTRVVERRLVPATTSPRSRGSKHRGKDRVYDYEASRNVFHCV